MTADEWKNLPKGTPVKVKANRGATVIETRTKRAAYYVGGSLRVPVEGMDVAVPVRDVEVIKQTASVYEGM